MDPNQGKPADLSRASLEEMNLRTSIPLDAIKSHMNLEMEIAAVTETNRLRELFRDAVASANRLRRQRILMRWIDLCELTAESWEVWDIVWEYEPEGIIAHNALIKLAKSHIHQ